MSGIKIQGKGTTLPASPEVGDAYILEEGGKNYLYLYFSTGWSNMGEFPAQGPQGIPGPQGDAAQIGNVYTETNTIAAGAAASVSATVYGRNVSFEFNIPRGSQGAQGPRGLKGETGPQGPEGPQGPQGDTGYTIRILGVLADYEDLPTPASVGYGGGYLIGSSPYNLYIVTGTPGSLLWTNVGPVTPQTITVDANMSPTSENPVQNKVINAYLTLISGNLSIVAGKVTALESSVSEINNRQLPNIYYELADLKEIVLETVAAVAEYTVDPCDSFATPLYITIDDVAYPVLEDADAELSDILGRSIAYNQIIGELNATSTVDGVTFTKSEDGRSYALTASDATASYVSKAVGSVDVKNGHKYLVSTGGTTTWSSSYKLTGYHFNPSNGNPAIYTQTSPDETILVYLGISSGVNPDGQTAAPCTFDLTVMFGAGNEPTSVDDPRVIRLVNEAAIAANAGEIKDSVIETLESVGFNQFDEDCEVGSISSATGQPYVDNAVIRSKNFIEVIPNTTYFTYVGSMGTGGMEVFDYDANKNYIGNHFYGNYQMPIPSNVKYIKFRLGSSYGTTYKGDICINVSNASLNGQYRPYKKTMIDFAELQPDAEKRTVRSAGTVRDSIVPEAVDAEYFNLVKKKRIGAVNLGTLDWIKSSSYPLCFVASLSGYKKPANGSTTPNILSAPYKTASPNEVISLSPIDKAITVGLPGSFDNYVVATDSTYADAAAFRSAMSNKYLDYELATDEDVVVAENILFDEESILIERGGTVTLTNASASDGCLPGLSVDIPVKRFQN